MAVSEEKMRIVIDNYFKSECDVNTSIRQAFEKGFRIGVTKGQCSQPSTENKGDLISRQAVDDVIAEIKSWYWQADRQALAKDPCVVDSMVDLFIRTIYKHIDKAEKGE